MAISDFRSLVSHVMDNVTLSTDYFGRSVMYTLPGGETTPLTAMVHEEETETDEQGGVTQKIRSRQCTWSTSELSTVNEKAKITIGDEDWSIAHVVSQDEYQITVQLKRFELREHTRPDFRRRR